MAKAKPKAPQGVITRVVQDVTIRDVPGTRARYIVNDLEPGIPILVDPTVVVEFVNTYNMLQKYKRKVLKLTKEFEDRQNVIDRCVIGDQYQLGWDECMNFMCTDAGREYLKDFVEGH